MSSQAVMNDTHVWHDGRAYRLAGEGAITPARLLALAERLDVKSLWIMPDTTIAHEAIGRDWLVAPDGWTLGQNSGYIRLVREHTDALVSFSGWRAEGAHQGEAKNEKRVILFLRPRDKWGLAWPEHPLVLLAALDYVEQALGLAPLYSPGYIGQQLMRRSNAGARHSWTTPVDLSPFPVMLEQAGKVQPFTWQRSPSPAEAERPYLISIDKNSAWPAACTKVELGIGAPRHVDGREAEQGAARCGCYRLASITPPPALPCPLPTIDEIAPDGWLWSPMLATLRKLGYEITLAEGYCWQESRTILRPWAEHIWQARQSVRSDHQAYPHAETRELAQQMIKLAANIGLQWLDLRREEWTREDAYHRPDWHALILDRARAAQLEQIVYFWGKYRLAPLRVYVDALYYAATLPEVEQSMPGVLARSGGLGGYKDNFNGQPQALSSLLAPAEQGV